MKENIVPIDENVKLQRQTIEFAQWLQEQLQQNTVAAMCVRGVQSDGEPFAFDIVALDGPAIRYMMIGQLQEAVSMLVADE